MGMIRNGAKIIQKKGWERATYNEGVFGLDGDVPDASVFLEGFLDIFHAGPARDTADVDLRVPRHFYSIII